MSEKGDACVSLICGIQKINECILQNKNRLTDTENKLVVTGGREGGADRGVD